MEIQVQSALLLVKFLQGDDSSTLLAFVTTREETTFSDGWEIVHQFDPCYYEGGDTRQIMYVLKNLVAQVLLKIT